MELVITKAITLPQKYIAQIHLEIQNLTRTNTLPKNYISSKSSIEKPA